MSGWVFVNGGCGYLGSHICAHLKTVTDRHVMMVDTRAACFPHITRYSDIVADESFSSDLMLQALRDYKPRFVIHCADQSSARKGLLSPLDMWESNASEMVRFLRACVENGVSRLVFFSTSDVYMPSCDPLKESSPVAPFSAYARTKQAMENMLRDCYVSHGLSSIVFRTSAIAGNHPLYDIGPLRNAPYLVPRIMESMMHGKRLTVFSRKHPTPDGTAIRDYLHVMDAASAVAKSLEFLDKNPGCHVINLGTGNGVSVQQMINMAEELFSRSISYSYGDGMIAEAPIRIVDPTMAMDLLGWRPTRTTKEILLDSFKWYNGDFYRSIPFEHGVDD